MCGTLSVFCLPAWWCRFEQHHYSFRRPLCSLLCALSSHTHCSMFTLHAGRLSVAEVVPPAPILCIVWAVGLFSSSFQLFGYSHKILNHWRRQNLNHLLHYSQLRCLTFLNLFLCLDIIFFIYFISDPLATHELLLPGYIANIKGLIWLLSPKVLSLRWNLQGRLEQTIEPTRPQTKNHRLLQLPPPPPSVRVTSSPISPDYIKYWSIFSSIIVSISKNKIPKNNCIFLFLFVFTLILSFVFLFHCYLFSLNGHFLK